MSSEPPPLRTQSINDLVAAPLIFIFAFLIFWFSPVHQVTDSHYSMLLSEGLMKHRSFALDHFELPRLAPNVSTRDYYVMNGSIWQLELAGGHIYYYFPPGSSVLSIPFVAVANALGVSAANPDGTYNPRGERKIQIAIAAILMAVTAVVFYLIGRLHLSSLFSVAVALSAALGTQVWSTASRGMWSHTWATLLGALIVWVLLGIETGKRNFHPVLLASLMTWLYFVRPTGSVTVAAVTVFLFFEWSQPKFRQLFTNGRSVLLYALTVALWLGGFAVYSWVHFRTLLPSYYHANRLRLDLLPVALAGDLVSPSRGLFVYVPAVIFVIYLLVRHWNGVPFKRLVWLALTICLLHVFFVSAFANLWGDWWGGASFGPRYTTELVPWFVLLTVLAVKGWQNSLGAKHAGVRRGEVLLGAVLIGLSVFINARGAVSLDTWKWSEPATDQQMRALLWDWRHPQFLAGLQQPPPPPEFPLVQESIVIDFRTTEAGKYLWYGWSGPEKDFRWSDGREATVVFTLGDIGNRTMDITMAPFLVDTQLLAQHIVVRLNGQELETLTLSDGQMKPYSIVLPRNTLTAKNVLTLEFPDAASPESFGVGADDRSLAIKVETIRFRSE